MSDPTNTHAPFSAERLEELLDSALRASLRAGAELLRIYRSDYAVSHKADASPVTEGDLASQKAILAVLQADAPEIPVLSEEQAEVPYPERRDWAHAWVVDPLDGTKEFLKENGEFTTNVALISAGRPILGVVYAPAVGTIYWGSEAVGAYRGSIDPEELEDMVDANALRARGQRLPIMAASSRPFTIAASRSHLNEPTEAYIAELAAERGEPAWITAGSAVKLCLVAEGSADVYPRLGTTMEWDSAAGDAVVRAAGGDVISYESGEPLRYNKPDLRNPWFVVRR